MITIGLDSSALQHYVYRGYLDRMLEESVSKGIEVVLYPSNIDELLQGIDPNYQTGVCDRLLKYIKKKNMNVICCSWRTKEKYILGNINKHDCDIDARKYRELVDKYVSGNYCKDELKRIQDNRKRSMCLVCIYLLRYRRYPNVLAAYIENMEEMENSGGNDLSSMFSNNEKMIEDFLKEQKKYFNWTLDELQNEIKKLKGEAPKFASETKKETKKYLKMKFTDNEKCAEVLKKIAESPIIWELKTEYNEENIERIRQELYKNYQFVFIPNTVFFRLVWSNIVKGGKLNIKKSTLMDAEMLLYGVMTKTDYFITADKDLFSCGEWVLEYLIRTSKPKLKYMDKKKEFNWLKEIIS